jgi:hypothetical protein
MGSTASSTLNGGEAGGVSTQSSPFTATAATYAPVFVTPHFSRLRLGVFPFVHTYGGYLAPSYPVCDSPLDCAPPLNSGYPETAELETGTVRLDVQPLSAQVFVDDYYVGTVDDFFHALGGLNLPAGPHRVEFRAPGFETVAVNMMIEAGRAITYRTRLKPEQP